MNTFLEERKNSLKSLKPSVSFYVNDAGPKFKNLQLCHQLEEIDRSIWWNDESVNDILLSPNCKLENLKKWNFNAQKYIRKKETYLSLFNHKMVKKLKCLILFPRECVDDEVLDTIAINCPKLETLDFFRCLIKDSKITDKAIRNIVMNCKNLKYLNLYGLPSLSPKLFYDIKEKTQIKLILNDVQKKELNKGEPSTEELTPILWEELRASLYDW